MVSGFCHFVFDIVVVCILLVWGSCLINWWLLLYCGALYCMAIQFIDWFLIVADCFPFEGIAKEAAVGVSYKSSYGHVLTSPGQMTISGNAGFHKCILPLLVTAKLFF